MIKDHNKPFEVDSYMSLFKEVHGMLSALTWSLAHVKPKKVSYNDIMTSTKLEYMDQILSPLSTKDKYILIFAQSEVFLRLLEIILQKHNLSYVFLKHTSTNDDINQLTQEWKVKPTILLLSYQCTLTTDVANAIISSTTNKPMDVANAIISSTTNKPTDIIHIFFMDLPPDHRYVDNVKRKLYSVCTCEWWLVILFIS